MLVAPIFRCLMLGYTPFVGNRASGVLYKLKCFNEVRWVNTSSRQSTEDLCKRRSSMSVGKCMASNLLRGFAPILSHFSLLNLETSTKVSRLIALKSNAIICVGIESMYLSQDYFKLTYSKSGVLFKMLFRFKTSVSLGFFGSVDDSGLRGSQNEMPLNP